MALSGIPFLGGFTAQKQQNEQAGLNEIKQVGGLQALLLNAEKQKLAQQAAQREAAFRQELQAAGPNADQALLAQIAAKYAAPGEVLKTQQSSLDRQAALAATREATESRLGTQRDLQAERLRQQTDRSGSGRTGRRRAWRRRRRGASS